MRRLRSYWEWHYWDDASTVRLNPYSAYGRLIGIELINQIVKSLINLRLVIIMMLPALLLLGAAVAGVSTIG
jgi:hypothetical protein